MDEPTIVSGKFYFRGTFQSLDITIDDGVISRISKVSSGSMKTNISGAIFPGSLDPHVHFRDPGETWKEDFRSGSISAVYGGTTAVIDMPNNIEPIDDYSKYASKLGTVRRKSFVDFGLSSLFTGSNTSVISKESSFLKIFTGGSTNSIVVSRFTEDQVSALGSLDMPKVFHLEDAECLSQHAGIEEKLSDHDARRPLDCEKLAFENISRLEIKRKVAAHSTGVFKQGEGYEAIEVTPHHLLLNNAMPLSSEGKVNPPLRSRDRQQELLQAFVNGGFSFVSSDHAPHVDEDKEDFASAKAGIAGVETRVPLMCALYRKGILDLHVFAKVTFESAPEIYGIKKGKVEVGYDADFVSFDLSNIKRINEDKLHTKRTVSPFNGFEAIFPSHVYLRGSKVIDDGELIEDHRGRYMPFSPSKEHVKES